jgi:hypothetical protein
MGEILLGKNWKFLMSFVIMDFNKKMKNSFNRFLEMS